MGARIVFAVFIVIGCTMFGRSMSAAARRRVNVLERLIRGLKMLRIHMSGMLERLSDALAATGCELMTTVGHEMRNDITAKESWMNVKEKTSSRGGMLDALTERDLGIMDDLFENLGTGGRREQEIIILNTLKRLGEQLESAKLQLSERERLYVSVGFLIGLMIALAVI